MKQKNVASSIHLFDAQTQKEVCRRLARLVEHVIFGRQLGAVVPDEYGQAEIPGHTKAVRQSPGSFAQMWNEVTDGEWPVDKVILENAFFTQ